MPMEDEPKPFEYLLHGMDTIHCSYHFGISNSVIDFAELRVFKEELRQSRLKREKLITLGGKEFMLQPYGTRSGYPFVIEDRDFRIQLGEYNRPNFFVAFKSEALWDKSPWELNDEFLAWAKSIGLFIVEGESLSRVDYSFDYYLPKVDFDEDSFLVRSKKDCKYRENKEPQTFAFGQGTDIMLRVYNKVDEIIQKSGKVWFFDLWERDTDVWRIEFQIRKEVLKDYGIIAFEDLITNSGDLLGYLVETHATLRVKGESDNQASWPLHPLWVDLQNQVHEIGFGKARKRVDRQLSIEARKKRMAISMLGYLKRFGSFRSYELGEEFATLDESLAYFKDEIDKIHSPMSWAIDVIKMTNLLRVKGEC